MTENKKQKEFVDFGNSEYCLVDGKIFVKLSKIFEMIERYESLEEFETFLGMDLDYIVATYLEEK